MSIPIFFTKNIENGIAHLADEEAFHCQSVLRKKMGDAVWVVDGDGGFYVGEILATSKKSAEITIVSAVGTASSLLTKTLSILLLSMSITSKR